MGKRELLLIVGFVILGGIVYQATAPPPAPGETGFSISRIIESLRREVRGDRASAQRTSTAVQAIEPAVTELRVTLRTGPLTIVGEERADVAAELSATSTGFDEAEAQQLIEQTTVKFDAAGSILFVTVHFPEEGQQRVRGLVLKVPARLAIRVVESSSGKLQVSGVESVELGLARGETSIRQIRGRVTISHRGGDLSISDAASLKLTTRGSDVTVTGISGEATINSQAGELKTSRITGPLEIEANATDVTLEGLETTTGMVRVNAVAGSVEMLGLRSESRIDLRNADLKLAVDRPAVIAIYSEGDEPVEVAMPADGFRIDAAAREAAITSTPADLLKTWGLDVSRVEGEGEQKLTGSVLGGGPLLTIRTRQGSITLAAATAPKPKATTDGGQRP